MDIDSLLQHIYPLIQNAIADLSIETELVFSELAKEAEDAAARENIEQSFDSFKHHLDQIDKRMMAKLEEQFIELSGSQFDEVAKGYKKELTVDDLRLVEHAALEEQVSLETMSAKALNSVAGELNLLSQRLNEGFKRKDIDDKTNPLGPAMFTRNFGEACSRIDTDIYQKLIIFKVFERTVLQSLKIIIANANANLKSQGILPNIQYINKTSAQIRGTSRASGGSSGVTEGSYSDNVNIPMTESNAGIHIPVATHMHTPSGMFDISDPIVKQIYQMVAKDGFGVLQKLLAESSSENETRISSSSIGDQNFANKKQVEDTELLDILNTLQHQAREDDGIPILETGFQRSRVAENIGNVLQTKSQTEGEDIALSKSANDVVNLVDMLFDFILSGDYLSDSVKSIISELQIPLTKVALLDKTFFSDKQHPARRLLNELSRSGISVPKEANAHEDKTYQSISKIVKNVKENFETETKVFASALEDFSENIAKQSQRSNIIEKRLIDVEKGRAKFERADEIVQEHYAKMLVHVPVSKEVTEFLNTAWRDVLMMTILKFGSHSKQWEADIEMTKKFMKSLLLAKKARLDKKRMKIPLELLKLFKKAMDRISYDPLESKRLLNLLAKNYQVIGLSTPESVREELIQFGGETAAAVRVVAKKNPEAINSKTILKLVENNNIDILLQKKSISEIKNEDIFKAASRVKKELTEAQKNLDLEREKTLEAQIEKEKQTIASSPMEALGQKIKNIEHDIFKAPDLFIEEEEHEFVAGNTWFDLASSLQVGTWIELKQASTQAQLRCKLAANIRTLQKLIFVNKSGVKVAERKFVDFARELKEKEAKIINDNTIFDQALENVIVNLRRK